MRPLPFYPPNISCVFSLPRLFPARNCIVQPWCAAARIKAVLPFFDLKNAAKSGTPFTKKTATLTAQAAAVPCPLFLADGEITSLPICAELSARGMDAHISKPLDIAVLERTIRSIKYR